MPNYRMRCKICNEDRFYREVTIEYLAEECSMAVCLHCEMDFLLQQEIHNRMTKMMLEDWHRNDR